jgi:hypothetical protein
MLDTSARLVERVDTGEKRLRAAKFSGQKQGTVAAPF